MIVEDEIRTLADKYANNLKVRFDKRIAEMKNDDTSHYLIYSVLGIDTEEGRLIDIYQNKGRFLYKYAGSFLEEAAKVCFLKAFPDSGSVRIKNTMGQRPKTFEIDCLVGERDAIEIKWRDATTDGDHITKEHTRMQTIKNAGYKPIRIMFYYPSRNQAKKIQQTLETLYTGVDGEYYHSDKAMGLSREIHRRESAGSTTQDYRGKKSIMKSTILTGDCLDMMDRIDRESIDLVYVDPPFFTQTTHQLVTRDGKRSFSFTDIWENTHSYADFLFQRMIKIREKMKFSGSIFFHCDKSASHIVRLLLDSVFGVNNFQSEIIWYFRRWSNARRGLLNSHQTIYFYSKSKEFKFLPIFQDYSPTTNIDQVMQKRTRDYRNKSVYARNKQGGIMTNGSKKGVPLGDVWEMPFLNPKAKERVGYPTQKPVLLLRQIMEITTEAGDRVLDPFCGSGTTLVVAKLLGRSSIGIDISEEAVTLTKTRLKEPIVTRSALLDKGKRAYETHNTEAAAHLSGIEYIPIHRNKGIDGLLKREINGLPVFLRVQRSFETQQEAAETLIKATLKKGACYLVLVATKMNLSPYECSEAVSVVKSTSLSLADVVKVVENTKRK